MRIALLKMQSKLQGGLEKYATRIASEFAKQGADLTFLTTQMPESRSPGIEYCTFPVCRWPGFLKLEQFDRCVSRWIKANPVDIVFGMDRNRMQTHIRAGNGVHAAYLKSRLASEGPIKYGLCLINPLHRKILELEKKAFESPGLKKIFVNSRMVQEEVLAHYAADPSKIEVIHNGIEWREHESVFMDWENGKAASIQKFNLDPNVFHLLFVGHGYRRKGLDQLLKALSIWEFKDFHLSVVGKDRQPDRYKALSEKLGLKNRVSFFGSQKEVSSFYQIADALIIPSFYDPFANVTLEALSFGVHVVSSKTNGGHEILSEENGTIIENLASTQSIAAALDRCLKFRKTPSSAEKIRNSVSHLDFSNQLSKLIHACFD